MDAKFQLFIGIMLFYILLAYVIFPAIFYYTFEKSLDSAGNGFITGSLATILLWKVYGRNLVVKK
jgi:hypothetical protein